MGNFKKEIYSIKISIVLFVVVTIFIAQAWTHSYETKPESFRFEDYLGEQQRMDAIKNLFPIGTKKFFIEKILVKTAGAHIINEPKENVTHYFYTPHYFFPTIDAKWNVTVYYNDKDEASKFFVDGFDVSKPLHPGRD